jgi:hypothetical protein
MPYWETGVALGYPGNFPVPQTGSTCIRFLLREPIGGIPDNLTQNDFQTENKFSRVVSTTNIGWFYIEKRQSIDKNCHQIKPSAFQNDI